MQPAGTSGARRGAPQAAPRPAAALHPRFVTDDEIRADLEELGAKLREFLAEQAAAEAANQQAAPGAPRPPGAPPPPPPGAPPPPPPQAAPPALQQPQSGALVDLEAALTMPPSALCQSLRAGGACLSALLDQALPRTVKAPAEAPLREQDALDFCTRNAP
jgi:hypothetical protein